MKLENVNPQSDARWQTLVAQQPASDVFHSPAWLDVLTDTYNFDLSALLLLDDAGQPRAGLAYSKIADMLDARIVSLPFSDFCDPLVTDAADWRCLSDRLLAEGCPVTLNLLHNSIPLPDQRLTLAKKAKWHSVDLRRDLETIWSSLHSSARRAIKKAEREGVEVRKAEDKEDLRAFFELHLKVRKYKYNLLAQPYRFFENIWRNFLETGHGALMLAHYQGEVIGGVLFIEWQDKLYYKFNASDPACIAVRPNDLVVWEGIKYGQAKGCAYLDFGRSDWDAEGLLRYKQKFATTEKTISILNYKPNGGPSAKDRQLRSLFPQLTDLLTDETVPDHVTEQAGDVLYRFFT